MKKIIIFGIFLISGALMAASKSSQLSHDQRAFQPLRIAEVEITLTKEWIEASTDGKWDYPSESICSRKFKVGVFEDSDGQPLDIPELAESCQTVMTDLHGQPVNLKLSPHAMIRLNSKDQKPSKEFDAWVNIEDDTHKIDYSVTSFNSTSTLDLKDLICDLYQNGFSAQSYYKSARILATARFLDSN